MSSKITRIWINTSNGEVPLIKVIEKTQSSQIVLAFNFGTSHITVHQERDGTFMATHHDINKIKGVWDSNRAAIAKHLGMRNWKKHGEYYNHTPLDTYLLGNWAGGERPAAHLGGLSFDRKSVQIKPKYHNDTSIIFTVAEDIDFIELFFAPVGYIPNINYDESFDTFLGKIHINWGKRNELFSR